jgi:predicted NAD-dependent protein-ADP-ribosyltransferase YbiA (DUF1768 family)/pSer/pThr/pTyr-binding forkhead associated (FHA) protein
MDPFTMNEKLAERQKLEEEFEKNANRLLQHQKLQKIDSFTGYFEFLGNNFNTPVYYQGILYSSVTHAFHAARSSDENTRKAILNAESLAIVSKIAKRIEDPVGWSGRRVKVMEQLIRDKFRRSKELQEKLKATQNREIVMTYEDESAGNVFWGVFHGKGQNYIGRILMRIRDDLKDGRELHNWITHSFEFLTDVSILPDISLTVNKNNITIDHVVLKGKPFFMFGALPTSDVELAHPSVSRYHAIIAHDKNLGVILVDLRSKAGTLLDGDLVRDHIPYRLTSGKKLNFAQSTRDYIVTIDTNNLKRVYEKELQKLEQDKQLLSKIEKADTETIKKSFGLLGEGEDVFINGIPREAVDEEIRKTFEDRFGAVKNFKCPIDRETNLKKGFAFLQFFTKEAAKECVDYGIVGYKDKMLKVKYADPKPDWGRFTSDDRRKAPRKKDVRKDMIKESKKKVKVESSSSESESSESSGSSSDSSSDFISSSSSSSSSTVKVRKRSRSRSRSRSRRKKTHRSNRSRSHKRKK